METIIGGYKISKISAGEMADYFERAFSRPSVKEMISNAATAEIKELIYFIVVVLAKIKPEPFALISILTKILNKVNN